MCVFDYECSQIFGMSCCICIDLLHYCRIQTFFLLLSFFPFSLYMKMFMIHYVHILSTNFSFTQSNVRLHTIPGIIWRDHSKYSSRHFLLIVVFNFHLHTKWLLFILLDFYTRSQCIQQNLRTFTKRYSSA